MCSFFQILYSSTKSLTKSSIISIVFSEKTLSFSSAKSQKCPGSNNMSTTPLSSSTSLHGLSPLQRQNIF